MVKVVCRCEDVTYDDVVKAINEGYVDLEELKRHLRCSMGTCQGRGCTRIIRQIMREHDIDPAFPNIRPPIKPVSMSLLSEGIHEK